MPKLSVNCLFKSATRMFKVKTFGASNGEECWYIQEVHEVTHDNKKFVEPVGSLFTKTIKEMKIAIEEGKIIVI